MKKEIDSNVWICLLLEFDQQKEVLEETTQMIPDSKRRLAAAYKDLQDMMTELEVGFRAIHLLLNNSKALIIC